MIVLLWVRKWNCAVCGEKVCYFSSCCVMECGCVRGRIRGYIPHKVLVESYIPLGDEPLAVTMRGVKGVNV